MPYKIIDACNGCGACVKICPTDAISGQKKAVHHIDEASCIECGACGKVCPKEAVLDANGRKCTMMKRSQWSKPVMNHPTCMSCSICIDACPAGCLAMGEAENRKDPHPYPFLKNEKACIGCGFCADECPVDSISMAVPQAVGGDAPLEKESAVTN